MGDHVREVETVSAAFRGLATIMAPDREIRDRERDQIAQLLLVLVEKLDRELAGLCKERLARQTL